MPQLETAHLRASLDFSHPRGPCDIVMKGGITSGVVYPLAVCAIAQEYRLHSIGGTSAGAIAAAAAAAAELGRDSATGGFAKLAEQPEWLGSGTRLFDLFQPDPGTRRVYRALTAGLAAKSKLGKVALLILGALRRFPVWAAIGALPGAAVFVAALRSPSLDWRVLVIICSVLLALLGALLAAFLGLALNAVRRVPENRFGLCSGYADKSVRGTPALTVWLADLLDELAGRPTNGAPLTFEDLWRGPDGSGSYRRRAIDLQMLTTNLSQGQPYRLPLEAGAWVFDPAEFRELFPKRVVDHMEAKARAQLDRINEEVRDLAARQWPRVLRHLIASTGLLPLPTPEDLPVIVATRLSLSFPGLLCAIPLHVVDFELDENQQTRTAWMRWLRQVRDEGKQVGPEPLNDPGAPKERVSLTRCWFSDGGITSNFPLPMFDWPIPQWPTFGINLTEFPPDEPDVEVWMPSDNAGGVVAELRRLEETPGLGATLGFAHSIIDTMQNWADNAQTRVPGYRDRVAHVRHHPHEGGLNLRMRKEDIEALSARGFAAGQMLVDRFSPTPLEGTTLTWDNHRWVRFRTFIGQLEVAAERLCRVFDDEGIGTSGRRSYDELLRAEGTDVPSYRLQQGQRELALLILELLRELGRAQEKLDTSMLTNSPRPTPELRVRPRI